MSKLLSLPECSDISGVHIDSLRRCARRGTLLANRVGVNIGPWKVRPKDLEAFMKKRNDGPNFDVFPGGLSKKKIGKKQPPVTREELNEAMEKFKADGGTIKRMTHEEEKVSKNAAYSEPTILDEIDENCLAD